VCARVRVSVVTCMGACVCIHVYVCVCRVHARAYTCYACVWCVHVPLCAVPCMHVCVSRAHLCACVLGMGLFSGDEAAGS